MRTGRERGGLRTTDNCRWQCFNQQLPGLQDSWLHTQFPTQKASHPNTILPLDSNRSMFTGVSHILVKLKNRQELWGSSILCASLECDPFPVPSPGLGERPPGSTSVLQRRDLRWEHRDAVVRLQQLRVRGCLSHTHCQEVSKLFSDVSFTWHHSKSHELWN